MIISTEMNSMRGKFFLDTNIFIYSFDSNEPQKQKKAIELIDSAVSENGGIISFQVIQEFTNVATKKFKKPMTVSDIRLYLNEVLIPLCEVYPSSEFYLNSLDIKERHGFSFYDSMIVEAAISTDCHTLFTEDMQHNMKIKDLVIKNPFKNL